MELSKVFADLIKSVLTKDEMEQVIIDNKNSDDCCHTHDYIDANIVMFEAFKIVYGDEPNIMMNSTHLELFNIAWHIAKESNFFTD